VDDRDRWVGLLAEAAAEGTDQPRRICELCAELLGITGAGISMVTVAGHRGVVCATDDVSARIEELQFSLGEGPCMDATRSGGPVLVPDLQEHDELATERWPAFLAGAVEAGVSAVFAFPLRIGAISVGALDLYRDRPGELRRPQLAAALIAADTAAVALLHLDQEGVAGFSDDDDLRSAYRLEVHQATGMVRAQLDIPIEEAFVRLRARAFATGRPLADLAKSVVERRIRFSQEDE
jgi:GAF domain-containing protein